MNKSQTQSFKVRFQLLEFDAKIFGFKIAKILSSKLSPEKLQLTLNKLQNQGVRLVYWPAASTDKKSQQAAQKLGGFLSSKQVTYLLDLKKIAPPKTASEVTTYRAKTPTTSMKKLALQIGNLSRFGTDPKIPRVSWHKLYHSWIKNSVNGSIADEVLVIRHKNKIIGMITLSIKNKRGDIGLLAVDANFRGKEIGTELVYAAQKYFIKRGYAKAQVVTQKANLPACHLYEKCGFHHEKTDNFYHFWL